MSDDTEPRHVADVRNELFDDAVSNGSVYFDLSSPIGPLYVEYGFAEGERQRFFGRIGSIFVRIGSIFGRSNIAR